MRKAVVLWATVLLAACSTGDDGARPGEDAGASGPRRVEVPSSITSDCSRSVEGAITDLLKSVPDGSTVVFERNGCYGQDRTIVLEDRVDLTIEGNGATFQKRVPSDPSRTNNANWRVAGGRGILLKDLKIRGSYDPPPRGTPGQGQFVDHGISLWGANDTSIVGVDIANVDGECLTADTDVRKGTDYRLNPPSRNITVDRLKCAHAGRQGVAATAVDGFTFSNSSIDDTQQNGLDIEIDVEGEVARNVKILNNTFGATWFSKIAIPIGNYPDVGDVLIQGNTVTRPPDTCYATIYVGDPRFRIGEITIVDNTLLSLADGVRLVNVDSGEVSRNRIYKVDPGGTGCDNPDLEPPAPMPVRVVDSSVTVEQNSVQGFAA